MLSISSVAAADSRKIKKKLCLGGLCNIRPRVRVTIMPARYEPDSLPDVKNTLRSDDGSSIRCGYHGIAFLCGFGAYRRDSA
jgi:hypothetical protein